MMQFVILSIWGICVKYVSVYIICVFQVIVRKHTTEKERLLPTGCTMKHNLLSCGECEIVCVSVCVFGLENAICLCVCMCCVVEILFCVCGVGDTGMQAACVCVFIAECLLSLSE